MTHETRYSCSDKRKRRRSVFTFEYNNFFDEYLQQAKRFTTTGDVVRNSDDGNNSGNEFLLRGFNRCCYGGCKHKHDKHTHKHLNFADLNRRRTHFTLTNFDLSSTLRAMHMDHTKRNGLKFDRSIMPSWCADWLNQWLPVYLCHLYYAGLWHPELATTQASFACERTHSFLPGFLVILLTLHIPKSCTCLALVSRLDCVYVK
jgi:hypothetical protein